MKLRIALFVLLTGLLVSAAAAIPFELWEEYYETDDNQAKGMDVAIYDNGNAIHLVEIAGLVGVEESTPSLRLDKIDGNGGLLWQMTAAETDSGMIGFARVLTLDDGGAVVAYSLDWNPEWYGQEGTEEHGMGLVRVDGNGDIVWENTTFYMSRAEKQVQDIALIDGNLVVSGWWGAVSEGNGGRTAHITTCSMDDGNVTSLVLVEELESISSVADVEILPDAIYICGSTVDQSEFLIKVNYDGEVQWTLPSMMNKITGMTLGMDGYLYLVGMNSSHNFLVACADTSGFYHWQELYNEDIPTAASHAIEQLSNGLIAVWKNNLQIVLIDSDGTRVYEDGTFGEPDEWGSNSMALYPNGDLLLSSSGIEHSVLLTRVTEVTSVGGDLPSAMRITEFELSAAHPNPFNAMTTLSLSVPTAGEISVSIVDVLGRAVDEWSLTASSQGTYELSWTADGFASGLYFVRATGPTGASSMQKLVLVR